MKPALPVDCLGSRPGIVVIAAHHIISATAEFPRNADGTLEASERVDDFDLELRQDFANGLGAQLYAVISGSESYDRGCFGQSVRNRELGQVHFLHRLPHQRLRTESSGHYARPQA